MRISPQAIVKWSNQLPECLEKEYFSLRLQPKQADLSADQLPTRPNNTSSGLPSWFVAVVGYRRLQSSHFCVPILASE